MAKGVLAVFSNINTASYETLKSFANFYEIPFITMTHPVHVYNYLSGEQDINEDEASFPAIDSFADKNPQSSTAQNQAKFENRHDGKSTEDFVLTMHPDLVPLLVSMIKYNRWKNIYYVYDNEEGFKSSHLNTE